MIERTVDLSKPMWTVRSHAQVFFVGHSSARPGSVVLETRHDLIRCHQAELDEFVENIPEPSGRKRIGAPSRGPR